MSHALHPIASARRLLVVGHSGAGKSTLACQLGKRLDLPVVHLDRLYWQSGWNPVADDVFRERLAEVVVTDRWIIDGGYASTLPLRLERAQAVIWLDFPVPLLAWRIVRRWRQWRGRTRPDMGEGCPEKIDLEFARWIVFAARANRRRIGSLLAEPGRPVPTFRLTRPQEVAALLGALPRRDNASGAADPHERP